MSIEHHRNPLKEAPNGLLRMSQKFSNTTTPNEMPAFFKKREEKYSIIGGQVFDATLL